MKETLKAGREPIVLCLVIERDEPIQGRIEPREGPGTPFQGWMDLIAAINHIRAGGRP